jgi:hypothetical protein
MSESLNAYFHAGMSGLIPFAKPPFLITAIIFESLICRIKSQSVKSRGRVR